MANVRLPVLKNLSSKLTIQETIALFPCDEDEYIEKDGTCKFNNFPCQIIITTMKDNEPTELTFFDKVLRPENQKFPIFAEDYTLDSSWSAFGLDSLGEYVLDN